MPDAKKSKKRDPIKPWFEALESTGEYIGIRFGRLAPGSKEVEWRYLPHSAYDGIGGFGHLLREAGVPLDELPQISHASPVSWIPFLKSLSNLMGPRPQLAWRALPQGGPVPETGTPAPAVAWHVFSEDETGELLAASRREAVTLNTFLLKHLDQAVRPDLANPSAVLPWMIPVNLRGKVQRARDTENHTSYIALKLHPEDDTQEVHKQISRALAQGEHWGPWKGYSATRLLPAFIKRLAIKTNRAISQWNVGGFSNLGVWDPAKTITATNLTGSWLFCPPVLRCQMVGAGCITFQGRLSLLIQVHPELTTASEVPARWVRHWLDSLRSAAKKGGVANAADHSAIPEDPEPRDQRDRDAVSSPH